MPVWDIATTWCSYKSEGRLGWQQKARTLKFPAQIVGESRREAMWPTPGTSGDTRQGWFPYTRETSPLCMNVYWRLLFALLLAASSSVGFNFPRLDRLETGPWEGAGREADQQPATLCLLEVPLGPAMFSCNLEGVQHCIDCTRPFYVIVQRAGDHLPVGGATTIFLLCSHFFHTWFTWFRWKRWKIVEMEPNWGGVDVNMKINSHTVTDFILEVKKLSMLEMSLLEFTGLGGVDVYTRPIHNRLPDC